MNTESNREQVYDEQINPLMAKIIEICEEHGIAMFSSFLIPSPEDESLCATTLLPGREGHSSRYTSFAHQIGAL